MSKPIIGVMPLWDDEKNSLWMLPGYFEGLTQAGGIPIMLPLTNDETELDQLMEMCNGFLFTGGHDGYIWRGPIKRYGQQLQKT